MADTRRIVLVKVSAAAAGDEPVGARYEAPPVAMDLAYDAALRRAWRALSRDLPAENPMCWAAA